MVITFAPRLSTGDCQATPDATAWLLIVIVAPAGTVGVSVIVWVTKPTLAVYDVTLLLSAGVNVPLDSVNPVSVGVHVVEPVPMNPAGHEPHVAAAPELFVQVASTSQPPLAVAHSLRSVHTRLPTLFVQVQ
jgi:hypothetical protein